MAYTTDGRELNTDMYAGSGPELTGSQVGVDGELDNFQGDATKLATGSADGMSNDPNLAVVKATFDKIINWRLRFEPMYQKFATVKPVRDAAYPGSKVTLFRTGANGLPLAKDPLSEYHDPDAMALPGLEDSLDISVNEYGNATVVTQRLKRFSWTTIDPMQAEYVGRNMRDTVDAIYMEAVYGVKGGWLDGGFRQAQIDAAGEITLTTGGMEPDKMFPNGGGPLLTNPDDGGVAATAAAGPLTASAVRRIVAHFRSLGVRPMADGYYVGLVTPEVALQLREDSGSEGANGWRYPHLDGSWNGSILNGTVGIFEGVRFIESPTFKGLRKGQPIDPNTSNIINVAPDDGSHNCLFIGAEGIADVTVEAPHTVVTPTTDRFGRLAGLGWIGTFGCQVYDNNAGLLVAVDPSA
jgi:N4-gp56 family major capsid protein